MTKFVVLCLTKWHWSGLSYDASSDVIDGYEDLGLGGTGKTKAACNSALVFMVKGVCAKWKQPFGFFLSFIVFILQFTIITMFFNVYELS